MIGRLNHVAIAVRDIAKAAEVYRKTLGATVSAVVPQPAHGVNTVFITLPNTKIELLEPLGPDSPIAKFLERNPDGGIHHVCYEVDDILAARDRLKAAGRPRAGRRQSQDRRPRQAGAVPASQGLLRHAGRARAGLMAVATAIAIYFLIWWIVLFAVLPWGVRAQGEESAAGDRSRRAARAQAHGQADLDDGRRRRGVGDLRVGLCQGLGDASTGLPRCSVFRSKIAGRQGKKIEQGQSPAPISLGLT